MLLTLSALIAVAMPALFQGSVTSQAATASAGPRPISSRDSTRALKLAHKAQGDFETLRRRLLPYAELSAAGGCDATVGRYCFREEYAGRPTEVPAVIAARTRLLTTLDSVSALMPGDRWILGQRLRYLFEAGRPLAADSMAIDCAARATVAETGSWCLALMGYTAQQLGNYPRADAAFTSALEKMPAEERCQWEDLAQFLGRAAGPYRVDCSTRDSVTAGFWRLVQPLYLTSVNDLRTEYFARITRMYIEQDTKTPMSDWWTSDDRNILLRYGVATWYAQGDPPRGEFRPRIAGFRRQPAFNFFPDAHVFDAPNELSADDWQYADLGHTPTYAPLWAESFRPITDHQVALFRRGDSALVVAAFDIDDGAGVSSTRKAGAFAAIIDGNGGVLAPVGTTVEETGSEVVSTLEAPWRPLIISLESLNSGSGAATRARFAPKLPATGSRLSLSDLLFYTPRDSTAPATLSDAVPRALHAERAPSSRQIGVFWEAYGVRAEGGESVNYALLVTPEGQSILHRAFVKLHLMESDRTLSVQWREVPAAKDGIASRGVTVDLSRLKPGRYSVRLSLTSGTEPPIVAERSIEIL